MRKSIELYGAAEFVRETARVLCIMAGIAVLVLCFYLTLLWLAMSPLRWAWRRQAGASASRIQRSELEALAALALSGLALLRSGQAPMTKREWRRRHRRLMAQRPDDTIPF